VDLWFKGIKRPIRLEGIADNLLPMMREIINTWPCQEKTSGDSDPVIKIWGHDNGFSRTSPWLDEPKSFPDPVNAICDFIVDLVHAYNADNPKLLCLHCAATIICDRIVIFPNGYNQGKSTFMALLASQHEKVLCDDVMPLNLKTLEGQSLGIQPRLRNPPPAGLGLNFDSFIGSHAGPHSNRYQYLNLGPALLAGFGEAYPIGGVVILERNESGETAMTPASEADALKAIILRNFADSMPAAEILDGLCALIKQAHVFRLNYTSGDRAASLMLKSFGQKGERGT